MSTLKRFFSFFQLHVKTYKELSVSERMGVWPSGWYVSFFRDRVEGVLECMAKQDIELDVRVSKKGVIQLCHSSFLFPPTVVAEVWVTGECGLPEKLFLWVSEDCLFNKDLENEFRNNLKKLIRVEGHEILVSFHRAYRRHRQVYPEKY